MLSTKRALHINSYFPSNNIHYHFYREIRKYRDDIFFIPVHKHFEEKKIKEVDIDYVFTKFDRKVFFTKVFKVVRLFYKKKFNSFDYLHAHTLMSDGIPTFIISLLKRKKFVVSIRNTDTSIFIERSVLFRVIGKIILKRASLVFFISPSLKRKIQSIYPEITDSKFHLLPNGLDPFWLSLPDSNRKLPAGFPNIVRLLFVGEIIPRKNIDILLRFLQTFTDRKYILTVVGRNTSQLDFEQVSSNIKNGNTIVYTGEIQDKIELNKIYERNDIFVLLSHAETFGVAYIEALSRGLPIIYSRNEGLDGFFEEGYVGYRSAQSDIMQLKDNIEKIIQNYTWISSNTANVKPLFSWDKIIGNYLKLTDVL